jgi:hypothetical protein
MKRLTEIEREVYGHDATAINRRSTRKYRDMDGKLYLLSRCLDGCPPFFEVYGPYTAEYVGVLPQLKVNGQVYWGDGWGWQRAVQAFLKELGAELETRKEAKAWSAP